VPLIIVVIGAVLAYVFNKRLRGAPVPVSTKNTAQEITDRLDDISRHKNMDRNDTCLGLKLIRENFDDWYNEINAVLPLDKVDIDENIRDFGRFIDTRAREPSGRASLDFLYDIRQRCERGGKQGFSIEGYVSKKLSLDTIDTIRRLVTDFFYPTIDKKMEWYRKYKDDPTSITDEDIRKWKADLKKQTNEIDKSIRSALSVLQCK
jgi:hypothetical protein